MLCVGIAISYTNIKGKDSFVPSRKEVDVSCACARFRKITSDRTYVVQNPKIFSNKNAIKPKNLTDTS